MKRVFIFGILGHMGQQIANLIQKSNEFCLAGGYDTAEACSINHNNGIEKYTDSLPIFFQPNKINVEFDLIVDFSSPAALKDLIFVAQRHKVPLVIGTIGHSARQQEKIRSLANLMPVFMSSNFSNSSNAVLTAISNILTNLGEGFEVEIISKPYNPKSNQECQHNKNDAFLPDAQKQITVNQQLSEWEIASFSESNLAGHEIFIRGQNERIYINQQTFSPIVFAEGALYAASFISDKKRGFFTSY